jgi:DNA-binding MarR family transcriptional regulator
LRQMPVYVRCEGVAMTEHRLSRLQRCILAWLAQEEQRTRGTMAASHQDLVQALGHEKGNLSHSLRNLEAKGLVRLHRTAGSKAEALDLTPQGRKLVAHLAGSCE